MIPKTKSTKKLVNRRNAIHRLTPSTRIKTAAANAARARQVPGVPQRKR
jgi:hypothetical protein